MAYSGFPLLFAYFCRFLPPPAMQLCCTVVVLCKHILFISSLASCITPLANWPGCCMVLLLLLLQLPQLSFGLRFSVLLLRCLGENSTAIASYSTKVDSTYMQGNSKFWISSIILSRRERRVFCVCYSNYSISTFNWFHIYFLSSMQKLLPQLLLLLLLAVCISYAKRKEM